MRVKGDDRIDQAKIGAFLKELRKEKKLTQEQLAEKLGVTGRTVSRWETGVNLPDLSLLVELADYYDVDIREIIDGERKSENMEPETKETLLKVSDYAAADKKRTVKKTKRRVTVIWCAAIVFVLFCTLTLNFLFGNPVSKALAKHNAETILNIRFGRDAYRVGAADYWIEEAEYFVRCEKPGSPDSAFTMNFGMFGNYRYDNYDSFVLGKLGVMNRLSSEYDDIVLSAMEKLYGDEARNVCYGSILTGDNEITDASGGVRKLNRLSADEVALDQVFDYAALGEKYGEVVVMLEDTDLSAERLAALLTQLKAHLEGQGVRFYAISLSLTDRTSVPPRGDGGGFDTVAVWDFLRSDIYEPGLTQRVAAFMQR